MSTACAWPSVFWPLPTEASPLYHPLPEFLFLSSYQFARAAIPILRLRGLNPETHFFTVLNGRSPGGRVSPEAPLGTQRAAFWLGPQCFFLCVHIPGISLHPSFLFQGHQSQWISAHLKHPIFN